MNTPKPIHYAPGFGIVVINNDTALFAFSPHQDSPNVTHGFELRGEKAVQNIREWFDSHLRHSDNTETVFENLTEMKPKDFERNKEAIRQLAVKYYSGRTG